MVENRNVVNFFTGMDRAIGVRLGVAGHHQRVVRYLSA